MIASLVRTLRERLRREDGASLVITMIFIVGTAMVVTALVTYSSTSIKSARDTQSRHTLASDTSAAMDLAIDRLRNNSYANPTATCPVNGLNVPAATTGRDRRDIRLTCRGKAGTGTDLPTVPITVLNAPSAAVLTLGTSTGEPGIANLANGLLRIKGPIFSNSNIVANVPTPASRIEGINAAVTAKTGCTPGRVFTTVLINCSLVGNPAEGKDPGLLTNADTPNGSAIAAGYAQPTITGLVRQVVPAACPSEAVIDFSPGYYDDAVALTNLTSAAGGCNRTLHFLPGVYYFDFLNEEMGALPGTAKPIPAGPNVWTISNASANVVGGAERNWVSGTPRSFPGSCQSPLASSAAGTGVQFVFGGSSRLVVSAGTVELCGQYSATKPALVLYGATSGATALVASRPSIPTAATSPAVAFDKAFDPPGQELNRLVQQDGAVAFATIARGVGVPVSASVALTGMDLASQIPKGAVLLTAELRVTHKERSLNGDSISVKVTPNPSRAGTPVVLTRDVPTNEQVPAALRTDVSVLTGDLIDEVWQHGLSDVRIQYTVRAQPQVAGNLTLMTDLDSARLHLSWMTPSVRGGTSAVNGSNCVGALPPAPGCALLTTSGSGRVYLQGTTYAPRAKFDVNLANVAAAMFNSGLIARSLSVSAVPASTVGGVIATPVVATGGVTLNAYLVAYVCTGTVVQCAANSPPATGWGRVGRTEVQLSNNATSAPSDGGRKVNVLSWHVLE